jgi:hypothetical protein
MSFTDTSDQHQSKPSNFTAELFFYHHYLVMKFINTILVSLISGLAMSAALPQEAEAEQPTVVTMANLQPTGSPSLNGTGFEVIEAAPDRTSKTDNGTALVDSQTISWLERTWYVIEVARLKYG